MKKKKEKKKKMKTKAEEKKEEEKEVALPQKSGREVKWFRVLDLNNGSGRVLHRIRFLPRSILGFYID